MDFLQASAAHDAERLAGLLCDDATYWTCGKPLLFAYAGERSKAEICRYMATPSIFVGGASVSFGEITAEGDRVALEAETRGVTPDGRTYTNTYHYLFRFRDGRILRVKEYVDTQAAAEFFSPEVPSTVSVDSLDPPAIDPALSIQEQTKIAVAYVREIANGGIDEKFIADDMTAWSLSMGVVPRSRYWPRLKHVKAVFTAPLVMTIVSTIAGPGRVMVESQSCGVLYTGDEYRNDYVFLIEFNDKGQVYRVREYFNVEKLRATLLPALLRYEADNGLKA